MSILIISCSQHPNSKSHVLAETTAKHFDDLSQAYTHVDLRDLELPLCDGGASYGNPAVVELGDKVTSATGYVFAMPIYNYSINSALKSMIEHTGRAMTGKPFGVLAAAGGQGSYMAVMSFANSLQLDFRCVFLPRFVYATGEAFSEDLEICDEIVHERLERFAHDFSDFHQRLTA